MKLELKHLAPYLPYGLKIQGMTYGEIAELSCCTETSVNITDRTFQYGMWADIFDIKPILRPLSDLISLINIDFEDEKFKPIDVIIRKGGCHSAVALHVKIGKGTLGFKYFDLLLQWHFDVFGLIEKGLAIDINTIK
jgi:hypothetical protein